MNLSRIPYWIKGGLLSIIIAVLLLITSSFLVPQISSDLIMIFAFPFWIAGLDVGMRGTPAPFVEAITKIGLGILFTAGIYFLIGALLGAVYGSIKYRKTFLAVSLCVFIGIPILIALDKQHDFNRMTFGGLSKPEDCEMYEDPSLNSECYSKYYRMTISPAVCEKIVPATKYEYERDECVTLVGSRTADREVCMQFKNIDEQQKCIGAIHHLGPHDPYGWAVVPYPENP